LPWSTWAMMAMLRIFWVMVLALFGLLGPASSGALTWEPARKSTG